MPGEKGFDYDLVSLGKDGQPGGADEAADIANY
jgi:general secretion pathway protein G